MSPAGGDLQWGGGASVCCPVALRICLQAMNLVFHVNMFRLRTPPCWPGPTEAAFDAAVFWCLACCVTLGFGYLPTDLGRGSSHHWQPWSSWQACWPLLCINLRLGMLGLWEVFWALQEANKNGTFACVFSWPTCVTHLNLLPLICVRKKLSQEALSSQSSKVSSAFSFSFRLSHWPSQGWKLWGRGSGCSQLTTCFLHLFF